MLRLAIAAVVLVFGPFAAPAADWPRFLGPNGDGTSPETGILTNWPKTGLPMMWQTKLGVGYAPPSVAAGKLYHFDRHGDRNRLTCRNAATGFQIWTYEFPTNYEDQYGYDPGPRCCPVIDGDRVYVYGPEGILACVATRDGKEVWKLDTREQYHFVQNFFGVSSVPIVHGETLIVAVGGSPKGSPRDDLSQVKPNGTCVVGLDKRTGVEKWRCGQDLASFSSPMIVTWNGKAAGLYYARSGLLAFDPDTGKELFTFSWRAKIYESAIASNPVVVGNTILLSESYQLGAVLLSWDGTKVKSLWNDSKKDFYDRAMAAHWNTPIHHGGYVYGCSGRHTNEADLRCIDLKTGEIKWKETRTTRCTLVKVDGHLLSLGENGELRLFKPNPDKYEEVSRWEPEEISFPAWAPPVIAGGHLYLRGKDRLACYGFTAAK